MPTTAFQQAKRIGRKFESQVRDVLREVGKEKGIELIDSETLSYSQKKGWDCEVRLASGDRCKIEIKLDQMSELTNNVCIEESAVRHSIAPIWVYGLPSEGSICLYTMFLSDLARYVASYPIKRRVGEYKGFAALVPKEVFLAQPWVKKFKTINLN